MRKTTIYKFLLVYLILLGCNSQKKILESYKSQKTDFKKLFNACQEFRNVVPYKVAAFFPADADGRIKLQYILSPQRTGILYFSAKDYSRIYFNTSEPDPATTAIIENEKRIEIMTYLDKLNILGIQIDNDGIFVALSNRTKGNNPLIQKGIFYPTSNGLSNLNIEDSKIDSNVYIYETVVGSF